MREVAVIRQARSCAASLYLPFVPAPEFAFLNFRREDKRCMAESQTHLMLPVAPILSAACLCVRMYCREMYSKGTGLGWLKNKRTNAKSPSSGQIEELPPTSPAPIEPHMRDCICVKLFNYLRCSHCVSVYTFDRGIDRYR